MIHILKIFILVFLFGCGSQESPSFQNTETEKTKKERSILPSPIDENLFYGKTDGLHIYKDGFYNMIYHVELIPESNIAQIQWNVLGGRYHMYEDELEELKAERPFQRTILFLEKNLYTVQAKVFMHNSTPPSLRSIQMDTRDILLSNKIKMDLEMDKLEPLIMEEIHFKPLLSEIRHMKFHWEVKKLRKVSCSMNHFICHHMYEEESIEGKDYIFKMDSQSVRVQFKNPGRYLVRVNLLDEQNQPISKVTKRIKIDKDF